MIQRYPCNKAGLTLILCFANKAVEPENPARLHDDRITGTRWRKDGVIGGLNIFGGGGSLGERVLCVRAACQLQNLS